jgi:hypothetical protein
MVKDFNVTVRKFFTVQVIFNEKGPRNERHSETSF